MIRFFFLVLLGINCCCIKSQVVSSLFEIRDRGVLLNFQKGIDGEFSEDWSFDTLKIENIDHWEEGYLLTWMKKEDKLLIKRTYSYDLNLKFVNAHEQRFCNDTLSSQGYIYYKNNSIDYIIQAVPRKESLISNNGYWDYDVDYYIYEIYKDGILSCVYKVKGRNHYYMLFQKRKDKIELVQGDDCLAILSNNINLK
ncbi:MAG: hypothetical protein ACK5M3_06555 [Dysgonomonas sp.]